MSGRSTRVSVAIALVALTIAVFAQVRHHQFVDYDDMVHIVYNEQVHAGLTWQSVASAFTDPVSEQWWPLTRITQQIDHELWESAPGPVLLTNVALHAASAAILFLVLAGMTGATWRPAFVAAVFALHPLHVESVAWASERKDALSGLFFMLTLAAHAAYAVRPGSALRYAGILLLLTLGLLAKPMLVTLPFVLLLLDVWPLRRFGRRALLEKLPLLIPVVAICAITLGVQIRAGATEFGGSIPFDQRVLNAIESYAIYVRESFWPRNLTVFYPHPREILTLAQTAPAALALATISAGALALRRSRPYLLVGWLWYLGMLVPVIGLVQVGMQAHADRYMYLPLVGLSIMTAWAACDAARGAWTRRALAAVAVAVVASLGVATWFQIATWKDTQTLFERNLTFEPDSYEAHQSLATLNLRAERYAQAEHHYAAMYRILPAAGRDSLALFHMGMGRQLNRADHFDAAIARYEAALSLDPNRQAAHHELGLLLVDRRRYEEAAPHLEAAVARAPDSAELLAALAEIDAAGGRDARAAERYRAVLQIDPNHPTARNNLAWLLATGAAPSDAERAEALRLARESVAQANDPDPDRLDTLAAALAAAGRYELALETAERAIGLAREAGRHALAREIGEHLGRYRDDQRVVRASAADTAR